MCAQARSLPLDAYPTPPPARTHACIHTRIHCRHPPHTQTCMHARQLGQTEQDWRGRDTGLTRAKQWVEHEDCMCTCSFYIARTRGRTHAGTHARTTGTHAPSRSHHGLMHAYTQTAETLATAACTHRQHTCRCVCKRLWHKAETCEKGWEVWKGVVQGGQEVDKKESWQEAGYA